DYAPARLFRKRSPGAPFHSGFPRGHAGDSGAGARSIPARPAPGEAGGPAAGARYRSVPSRQHARARKDRAAGLQRSRQPAGDLEDGASRSAARVARAGGAPGCLMNAVEQSYDYCRAVARSRAKNFYYSFRLLTAQQRKAMCAIYAFMRYCDDLSDEPGATRAAIERWRLEMEDALEGQFSGHPVWPAFHHTVRRFGIPPIYLRE